MLYVLQGVINYEGKVLLGVYGTRQDAEDHWSVYELEHPGAFDNYSIELVELGAEAEFHI